MTGHSLPPEALRRFLAGTACREERREVARHLLHGCKICGAFFQKSLGPRWPSLPSIGPSYDQAFQRAAEIATRGGGTLDEPGQILLELLRHPPKRQEILIGHHRRYWSIPFCELLVRESYELRFSNPGEMQRLARLAVFAAERLGGTSGSTQQISECRSRAWMALGNALRVAGDLVDAERTLLIAQRHLKRSQSPLLRADYLRYLSCVRRDQLRANESIVLTQREIAIRRDLYSPADLAGTLVNHAMGLGMAGRAEDGLQMLAEAKIEDEDSPLFLLIRHHASELEMLAGRPIIALQLFKENKPYYEKMKDSTIQASYHWLNGEILAALGENKDAEEALMAAEQQFLERRHYVKASRVRLERSAVSNRIGRQSEVRTLYASAFHDLQAGSLHYNDIQAALRLRGFSEN